jgi:predicted AAA+ superfamily ATPase
MGPRQSGKTTLVKNLCKNYPYINLEEPDIREIADRDPRAILNKYPDGLIIDEIQNVPSLLSYIQAIVDEKQREGMYVLTGSHQLELHAALSQSLAGRTSILQLLPLSLVELQEAGFSLSTNELMLNGFYPRIYNKKLNPTEMYRDYVKTYLERDVRSMINVKDLLVFQRFMKLCAARTGTVLNTHNLASDVGVSDHTIKHWLSILQASYLIELVPPYFENFGKQAMKSPKLYFTDVGLVAYLLEIETLSQIDRDPLRGNLFETMVVMELMKARINQGREPHLYFYRDSQKHEVDIIYKRGAELVAVEIKSSETFHHDFLKGLKYFQKLAGERCRDGYLVYNGSEDFKFGSIDVINFMKSSLIVEEDERGVK